MTYKFIPFENSESKEEKIKSIIKIGVISIFKSKNHLLIHH